MNITCYQEMKRHDLDAFRAIDSQYVSKDVLFKKSEFEGLSDEERLTKAIEHGWRWDITTGKYYRIIGY